MSFIQFGILQNVIRQVPFSSENGNNFDLSNNLNTMSLYQGLADQSDQSDQSHQSDQSRINRSMQINRDQSGSIGINQDQSRINRTWSAIDLIGVIDLIDLPSPAICIRVLTFLTMCTFWQTVMKALHFQQYVHLGRLYLRRYIFNNVYILAVCNEGFTYWTTCNLADCIGSPTTNHKNVTWCWHRAHPQISMYNKYIQTDGHLIESEVTSGAFLPQTDRRRRIRANRATSAGGLKKDLKMNLWSS